MAARGTIEVTDRQKSLEGPVTSAPMALGLSILRGSLALAPQDEVHL